MNKLALILLLFMGSFGACAQKEGKITIKITDETSGKKKTIEKSFNSREEMYADKELREFGVYPFDIVIMDDSIGFELPISPQEIEEITEMAQRIGKEARISVSSIDIDEEEIRTQVEMMGKQLSDLELGQINHFERKKPD